MFAVQTSAVPRSTMSLIETVTSSVVMTIARGPIGAVAARSKVKAALCGVPFLSATFETPVDGLIAICDAVTRDRSKKPDELSVKLADVPVLTDFGVTGCGSAGEISNVRNKVAASATKNRWVAWRVMMHLFSSRASGRQSRRDRRHRRSGQTFDEGHVETRECY
ncbi:MAG TPA: hypothetical protein VN838_19705 [Bradyrhizobium sp.]|nr:hypothetical protein [Bradyrhizobium sp.]